MATKKKTAEASEEVKVEETTTKKTTAKKTTAKKEEPKVEEPIKEEPKVEVKKEEPKKVEKKVEVKKEEPKSEVPFTVEVIANNGIYSFKGPGLAFAKNKVIPNKSRLTINEVKGNWGKVSDDKWIMLGGTVNKI